MWMSVLWPREALFGPKNGFRSNLRMPPFSGGHAPRPPCRCVPITRPYQNNKLHPQARSQTRVYLNPTSISSWTKPPGLPNHGLFASPKHKQALAFRPDPLLTASYLTIYHTNLIHLNKKFFLNTGLSLSSKFLPPQRKLHQATC